MFRVNRVRSALLPIVAVSLMSFGSSTAFGASSTQSVLLAMDPNIVLAYGGCGPYGHRGPGGYCRPGGRLGGYVPGLSCPRGFHIGRYGHHCWPN